MRRSAVIAVALAVLGVCAAPAAAQTRARTVHLAPGWNNVAYVGPTRSVTSALAGIAGKYDAVWTWDTPSQSWRGMNPLLPSAGDFIDLDKNHAYWILMSAPADLAMDVPPGETTFLLGAGWNNFVYLGADERASSALAPAASRFDSVWRWDNAHQSWSAYAPAAPEASDFDTLTTSGSYFIRLSAGPSVALAPLPPAPAAAVGTAAPAPTPRAAASASAPARGSGCYRFQSYQPQFDEVIRADNLVGLGIPLAGPEFKLKDLETQPDGNGAPALAYVPPTLLKAIGWVESGWRQAAIGTARGDTGTTITSRTCAYGLMQVLTDMNIDDAPSPRQERVGTDYIANIAAGAQLLTVKWNLAPDHLPVVLPRNPRSLEDWYYAVWAYHCYGDACQALAIHNNPDDPALKWPRPMYNSPDQLASSGQFSVADYPYQEMVYGVIAHPPVVGGKPLWPALPVSLPPRGAIRFPNPVPFPEPSSTLDPTVTDNG